MIWNYIAFVQTTAELLSNHQDRSLSQICRRQRSTSPTSGVWAEPWTRLSWVCWLVRQLIFYWREPALKPAIHPCGAERGVSKQKQCMSFCWRCSLAASFTVVIFTDEGHPRSTASQPCGDERGLSIQTQCMSCCWLCIISWFIYCRQVTDVGHPRWTARHPCGAGRGLSLQTQCMSMLLTTWISCFIYCRQSTEVTYISVEDRCPWFLQSSYFLPWIYSLTRIICIYNWLLCPIQWGILSWHEFISVLNAFVCDK